LDKGDTEKQAKLVYNRTKAIVNNCNFAYFSDISASKVQRYLAERRRGGLSIRSSNFYLQAVKQFLNWMVTNNRIPENPLAYLKGQNPKTDIRHPRRALTIDELTKLLKVTTEGQKHHNMTGKERAILYKLAANTGYRANELASLRWHSFNLSDTPSVTVLAAYSKRRREDLLPLRSDISRELENWKSEQGTKEDAKLFPKFNPNKAADMLKNDLECAGIEYVDAAGRYADFHSLRHSFASILHQSGVSPKVAQALLRHSTISLTMDTYTHIGLYDERAAIDSLPALPGLDGDKKNENKAVALKTGTDNLVVKSDESAYKPAYKKLTKNAYSDSNQPSSFDIKYVGKQESIENDKYIETLTLGSECNQLSTHDVVENNRRRPDSNRRITVLQTVALGLLATPPNSIKR